MEDTDDFPFTETTSGMASPAHSDASHESNKFVGEPVGGHDESSNEALIVDCDSPSDHDAPGKLCYYWNIARIVSEIDFDRNYGISLVVRSNCYTCYMFGSVSKFIC